MPTNYRDAAQRHWDDARYLRQGQRLANADQLYGLAAECALKAIVVGLGGKTDAQGDLQETFGAKHGAAVWSGYRTYAEGRTATRYLTPLTHIGENPFDDWSIAQRYADHGSAPSDTTLARHADAASACQLALQRAFYDGIVK